MKRAKPPGHRGYEGSCIFGARTGVYFGHVINVRNAMIQYRFIRRADHAKAVKSAVEAYLADCRLAGLTPEKPVPRSAAEKAQNRRIDRLLRKQGTTK